MKIAKCFMRLGSIVLSLLLCLSLVQVTAFASSSKPTTGSFTALFAPDDKMAEGAVFNIYRIGDYSERELFTLNKNFSKYSPTIPTMDDSIAVNAFNTTLAAYIARDKIRPNFTATTNKRGMFTVDRLDLGMYLVVGEDYKDPDKGTYSPIPFLVFFPYFDQSLNRGNGGSSYQANDLEVKYEKKGTGDTEDYHVIKAWRNESRDTERPQKIAVDLLQDGEVYETIVLSEDNDWRYTWKNLEKDHKWQLVENKTPEGYTTSVSKDGNAYTVTNTLRGGGRNPITDPEEPGTTIIDRPPALIEMPNVPVDTDVPTDIITKPDPIVDIPDGKIPLGDIPQTGQTWWPVPLLLAVGIGCVVGGSAYQIKKRKENPKA